MKKVGQFILDELAKPVSKLFMLVKLDLNSDTYMFTRLPYGVYFLGEYYQPNMGVISFSPPRITTTVDKQTYELILQDNAGEHQSEIRNGVTGRTVSIYAGFINSLGQPSLDQENVLLAYEGVVDSAAIAINNEEKVAKYKLSSPMAALDARGGYMASKGAMNQINAEDTCFDEIYIGAKEVSLKWGKS
jgi:hypothetical protein